MSPEELERAINFLVEHQAVLDSQSAELKAELKAELADIRATMVTKRDFLELKQAMLSYGSHAENLMSMLTRSQLANEDKFIMLDREVESMKKRIVELERHLPPQQAA